MIPEDVQAKLAKKKRGSFYSEEGHYFAIEWITGRDFYFKAYCWNGETFVDSMFLRYDDAREATVDNFERFVTAFYDKFGNTDHRGES